MRYATTIFATLTLLIHVGCGSYRSNNLGLLNNSGPWPGSYDPNTSSFDARYIPDFPNSNSNYPTEVRTGYDFNQKLTSIKCCVGKSCPAPICAAPDWEAMGYSSQHQWAQARQDWIEECVYTGYNITGCDCTTLCTGNVSPPW